MTHEDDTLQIRSFRVCFRIERRLYRLDRWRIPVPHGVPLLGLGYGAAALVSMFVLSRLAVVGDVLTLAPAWMRYILVPFAAGYLLTQWKVDGRTAHAAGAGWLRWRLGPRRVSAFRRCERAGPVKLGAITVAPDERGARLRPGTVAGPAKVVLRYPAALEPRGRTLHVTPQAGAALWQGKQVNLREGQRVVIA